MAKKLLRKDSILGYVQPVGEGVVPQLASVFYHRVLALRAETGRPAADVLGAVLAHETGHLLLGKGSHSPVGIMRCPWDTAELRALSRGELVFEARQSRAMTANVALRRLSESSRGNPSLRVERREDSGAGAMMVSHPW